MSLDLEQEIRDQARDLAHLYQQLSTAIRTPPPPREARIMAAKPGPREPGNLFLISLDRDLVSRLHEYTRDCCNHLDPSRIITWDGAELCSWVAFNAQGVSELAFAPDLLEELQHQAHTLNRRLNPRADTPHVKEAAKAVTTLYTAADAAALASAATGKNIDRKQVTYWGRKAEGGITAHLTEDGTAMYQLCDVVAAAQEYKDQRKRA